jgi:hypothetical protein
VYGSLQTVAEVEERSERVEESKWMVDAIFFSLLASQEEGE